MGVFKITHGVMASSQSRGLESIYPDTLMFPNMDYKQKSKKEKKNLEYEGNNGSSITRREGSRCRSPDAIKAAGSGSS